MAHDNDDENFDEWGDDSDKGDSDKSLDDEDEE
jgi:hypothetical protein